MLLCVALFEVVSDKQGKLLGQRIQLSLTPCLLTMALLSPINFCVFALVDENYLGGLIMGGWSCMLNYKGFNFLCDTWFVV